MLNLERLIEHHYYWILITQILSLIEKLQIKMNFYYLEKGRKFGI